MEKSCTQPTNSAPSITQHTAGSQPAPDHRNRRAQHRGEAGDRREVVAEQDGGARRDAIDVVPQGVAWRLDLGVEVKGALRQEARVHAIAQKVGGEGANNDDDGTGLRL